MEQKKKRRIVLLEPSPLIVAGMKALLAGHPAWEVAGSFAETGHCQERMPVLHPDVLVVDPVAVDYSRRFHVRSLFPEAGSIAVVALVASYVSADVLKQYDGVVEINDDAPSIVKKLEQAAEARKMPSDASGNYELSERENEILAAVAKGLTNKEIADALNISVHTIISHRKNITRKTGIKTVSGLTVYALLNNLIDQSEVE